MATAHPNEDSLKQTIQEEWGTQTEAKVQRTYRVFRLCLEKLIAIDGGYID
jgi:hypothetical protein